MLRVALEMYRFRGTIEYRHGRSTEPTESVGYGYNRLAELTELLVVGHIRVNPPGVQNFVPSTHSLSHFMFSPRVLHGAHDVVCSVPKLAGPGAYCLPPSPSPRPSYYRVRPLLIAGKKNDP